METCTPRPNISIRSAHSVPNLYFEVSRPLESSLKNAEAVLKECDESSIEEGYSKCNGYDINTSNNNITSPQGIEIEIPFNDSCDDPFQRNTVRKSRKRYRAPAPPAAITQKTLPNSKYARNRNASLDLLIVKSDNPHIDSSAENYNEQDDSASLGFGNRSDDIRMSVLQRKAILEKQLKLRTNGPLDETLQGSFMKSIGSERKHLVNKDSPIELERDLKTVDVQKEIKRPFIPPPPPPPKNPPLSQITNHPRQQSESRISNDTHAEDKDDRNGCDTCVDWLLFLLCIA